jgi:hypothetical protein
MAAEFKFAAMQFPADLISSTADGNLLFTAWPNKSDLLRYGTFSSGTKTAPHCLNHAEFENKASATLGGEP